MTMKICKCNSSIIGFVSGLILPTLTCWLIFYASFDKVLSISEFVGQLQEGHNLTKLLSLGALPNLGLFFIFANSNKLLVARGVVGATILWALVVAVMRLAF